MQCLHSLRIKNKGGGNQGGWGVGGGGVYCVVNGLREGTSETCGDINWVTASRNELLIRDAIF